MYVQRPSRRRLGIRLLRSRDGARCLSAVRRAIAEDRDRQLRFQSSNDDAQIADGFREMQRQLWMIGSRTVLVENEPSQHLAQPREVPCAPQSFVGHTARFRKSGADRRTIDRTRRTRTTSRACRSSHLARAAESPRNQRSITQPRPYAIFGRGRTACRDSVQSRVSIRCATFDIRGCYESVFHRNSDRGVRIRGQRCRRHAGKAHGGSAEGTHHVGLPGQGQRR